MSQRLRPGTDALHTSPPEACHCHIETSGHKSRFLNVSSRNRFSQFRAAPTPPARSEPSEVRNAVQAAASHQGAEESASVGPSAHWIAKRRSRSRPQGGCSLEYYAVQTGKAFLVLLWGHFL